MKNFQLALKKVMTSYFRISMNYEFIAQFFKSITPMIVI